MQDKLNILLKQINFPEDKISIFDGATLKRIVGNKDRDKYRFEININNILEVEDYELFVNLLKTNFSSFKEIELSLLCSEENGDKCKKYFYHLLKDLSKNNTVL